MKFSRLEDLLAAMLWNLRAILLGVIDGFFLIRERSVGNPKAVLLVRLDAIGDFVLSLEAMRALIDSYQEDGSRVVLVGNIAWSSWAAEMGLADEVWGIDENRFRKQLSYRLSWIRRIRDTKFAVAIQSTYSRTFLGGDSLIRASGAARRIGSVGDISNTRPYLRVWSDRWYTHLIDASELVLMELERNSEFLTELGIRHTDPTVTQLPKLYSTVEDFELPRRYFVIFPGASKSKKVWPIERYADIAAFICGETGWAMVICGTLDDRIFASEIIRRAQIFSVDLTGLTSLSQLAEVIRGAELLVGNDTSAIHIAAAVQTESVCILGGGHFGRFLPYSNNVVGMKPVAVHSDMDCFGCNWNCHKHHADDDCWPCIKAVSLEAVEAQVSRVLAKAEA